MSEGAVRLSNPRLVTILGDGGSVYSGGDQAWLKTRFRRDTGCGSVSLMNQLYFYALRERGAGRSAVKRLEYVHEWERCFGGMGKPLSFIPTAWLYARLGERLLRERGINVRAVNRSNLTVKPEAALAMMVEAIKKDEPVALQNWWCRKGVRSFHWVTVVAITGYESVETAAITVSTWGRLVRYRFLDAWSGKASMVYFERI